MLKYFSFLLLLGLSAARLNISNVNLNALRRPQISANLRTQPFWDNTFCDDWEDLDAFPHPDSCKEYLICWHGELWEMECGPGMLFDPWDAVCDYADQVICLDDPWPEEPDTDDECPPAGSNEIRFLPSNNCDEYYICMNGQPQLRRCRPGQHWNAEENFCDDPHSAGCDPDASPNPPSDQLPDCPPNFRGEFPHPHNCNWFVHCNFGSRSIQQCQHLHHFDMVHGRCIFKTAARCIKNASSRN